MAVRQVEQVTHARSSGVDGAANPAFEPPSAVVDAVARPLEECLAGLHSEDRIAADTVETNDQRSRMHDRLCPASDN
jgi:hypothetical protein